jgi:hypothetical protein
MHISTSFKASAYILHKRGHGDGLVQQHIHPNIQQDMDLWHIIREYDKKAA